MPAYDRVLQRFQNNLDLDAGDLNALVDDLRAWVSDQLARFQPSSGGGGTPNDPTVLLLRDGTPVLLRDGTSVLTR